MWYDAAALPRVPTGCAAAVLRLNRLRPWSTPLGRNSLSVAVEATSKLTLSWVVVVGAAAVDDDDDVVLLRKLPAP